MLQLGFSVGYVHKHIPGQPGGSPHEALVETRAALLADNAHPVIQDVLNNALVLGEDFLPRQRAASKFLLGTTGQAGPGDAIMPLVGLLYAEGHEGKLEHGGFSVIRMATWVSSALRDGKVAYDDEPLEKSLIEMSLGNVEKNSNVYGVPVERMTKVQDLEGSEQYVYGHKKDLEAIDGLAVPQELSDILRQAAIKWHN